MDEPFRLELVIDPAMLKIGATATGVELRLATPIGCVRIPFTEQAWAAFVAAAGPTPVQPLRAIPEPAAERGLSGLTVREREILTHLAEGMANAEIARKLWITEQTVKFHLSNLYRKLNVTNRTQASRYHSAEASSRK